MPDTEDKTERAYDPEHYALLKKCSDKKDMTEWNEFVRHHFPFGRAKLEKVWFIKPYLKNAFLQKAHLENANILYGNLENTTLIEANLKNARLIEAHLENAMLIEANLENANLSYAHLENTNLHSATCNGSTRFIGCHLNKRTDFRGVALNNIQWGSGLKQLAEYNNRRLNWIDWYKEQRKKLGKRGWLKALFVWLFWECSDYGRSTSRILWTFTGLSLLFAGLYFMAPGMLTGLNPLEEDHLVLPLHSWSLLWRCVYFSVVTMTTLGFGDIHANPKSPLGHGLLMLQVIIGYVILGALVTRLSILFNSDGPSADFAEADSKKNWIGRLKDYWKEGWGEKLDS
jgi:hypothetical protein